MSHTLLVGCFTTLISARIDAVLLAVKLSSRRLGIHTMNYVET